MIDQTNLKDSPIAPFVVLAASLFEKASRHEQISRSEVVTTRLMIGRIPELEKLANENALTIVEDNFSPKRCGDSTHLLSCPDTRKNRCVD